jgi:hypothetical protein
MRHLTEEELIGQAYGEGDKAHAAEHLAACAACARAYGALESDLAEFKTVEPPPRDAAYGEKVWAAVCGSLPAYEVEKRSWLRGGVWKSLSFAGACALLIASAFVAGRFWERHEAQITASNHPQPAQPHVAPPQQRVVVVVLSDHLDRSERLLVELKHADADSAEMVSPMRDEARSLLAANRICRQKAKQEDDPALTTALDHLEQLLDGLANQPGGLNPAAITRLQDEMNTDGLLFEVRVLRSRISHETSAEVDRTKGGTI